MERSKSSNTKICLTLVAPSFPPSVHTHPW